MHNPRVAIHMAVHNGALWLPWVLDSVKAQTYQNIEVKLWDNASSDDTIAIAQRYPHIHIIHHDSNTSFWTAQEEMLKDCTADYVVALTDVILDEHFIERAVAALEADATIGAVQGKILAMTWLDGKPVKHNAIDAVGFRVERSRRVTILGHGERDHGQYDTQRDVFGVEGAVPVFRRAALEASRVDGHVVDPNYRVGAIGYGDDLDLAWRMQLFGWRQVLVPRAIGWHDRSTTKDVAHSLINTVSRKGVRSQISLQKRRLDWSNVRFTIIKNERIVSLLRDAPRILWRELMVQGYFLLFEPSVLLEWDRFFWLLSRMLTTRRAILKRAVLSARQMRALMS